MSMFALKNGMKLYYEDRGSGQPVTRNDTGSV